MKVLLREVTDLKDCELILAWRNNPEIYKGLYTQAKEHRPLSWEEHYDWCQSPDRSIWQIFIIQVNDYATTRDVGYFNVAQLDHWRPEIGYVIGEPLLHGKGICTQAVKLGLEWIKKRGKLKVHTSVLKNNLAGIRVLEKCGFNKIGEARKDEWEYEIDLHKHFLKISYMSDEEVLKKCTGFENDNKGGLQIR